MAGSTARVTRLLLELDLIVTTPNPRCSEQSPARFARWFLPLTHSWATCPLGIAFLSIPVTFSVLWAMKGLAPTRLRLAGASAGLAAGTLGTLVYTLHCPEVAAPFIGTWYVLGMLIRLRWAHLMGPRVLRW